MEVADAFSQGLTWVAERSYTSVLGGKITDRAYLVVWLDLSRGRVACQIPHRTLKRTLSRAQRLWDSIFAPLRAFYTGSERVARYSIVSRAKKWQ